MWPSHARRTVASRCPTVRAGWSLGRLARLSASDQPADRRDGGGTREHRRHGRRRQAHVPLQHPHHDRTHVGGRLQVATLVQLVARQARPARHHPATRDGATGQEHGKAGAVVGAPGAVRGGGAPELGDGHHHGVGPGGTKAGLQRQHHVVERAEPRVEAGTLVEVGVERRGLDRGHARPVGGGQQRARLPRQHDLGGQVGRHPGRRRDDALQTRPVRDRRDHGRTQQRVGPHHLHHRGRQRRGRSPERGRRPAGHRRRPPDHERRGLAHRDAGLDPRRRRHQRERAVQPAVAEQLGGAGLQVVLAFEVAARVGAVADRVDHQRLVGLVHALHGGQLRVHREVAAEVQHPAAAPHRPVHQRGPQLGQVRVAVRCHGRQPVETAAHVDHDKPRVGRCGRIRDRRPAQRQRGPHAQQRRPPGDHRALVRVGVGVAVVRTVVGHQRLWNSGDVSSSAIWS